MPRGGAPTLVQGVVLRRWGWHARWVGSVHEAAGGDEGLLRLAEAWHRQVVADDVVGHAFG